MPRRRGFLSLFLVLVGDAGHQNRLNPLNRDPKPVVSSSIHTDSTLHEPRMESAHTRHQ